VLISNPPAMTVSEYRLHRPAAILAGACSVPLLALLCSGCPSFTGHRAERITWLGVSVLAPIMALPSLLRVATASYRSVLSTLFRRNPLSVQDPLHMLRLLCQRHDVDYDCACLVLTRYPLSRPTLDQVREIYHCVSGYGATKKWANDKVLAHAYAISTFLMYDNPFVYHFQRTLGGDEVFDHVTDTALVTTGLLGDHVLPKT
jgi:hypothetical protein